MPLCILRALLNKGAPDLAALAKQYADIGPESEQMKKLKSFAEKGTAAVNIGAKPFGRNNRDILRSQTRLSTANLAICGSSSVASILDVRGDNAALAIDVLGPHHHAPSLCAKPQVQGIKALSRHRFQSSACESRTMHNAIATYVGGEDSRLQVARIAEATPGLVQTLAQCTLHPESDGGFQAFEWKPVNVVESLKAGLSLNARRKAVKLLHESLSCIWSETCSTLPDTGLLAIDATIRRRPCWAAGMCICTSPGREKHAFV